MVASDRSGPSLARPGLVMVWDPCGAEASHCALVEHEHEHRPRDLAPARSRVALYDGGAQVYGDDVDRTPVGTKDELPRAARGPAADVDLRDLLVGIVRSACALTGARYGALGVVDQAGLGLVEFVTEGLTAEERAAVGHLPRGRGLLGHLISHPEVLRIRDLTAHSSSTGFPSGHPAMTSLLGVPIRVRDRVFGNLYLTDKEPGARFTADDEHAVVALASLAGLAIEHAHLLVSAERRARWTAATATMHTEVARLSADDAFASIVERAMSAGRALGALVVAAPTTPALVVRAQVGALPTPLDGLGHALQENASTVESAHRITLGVEHLVVAPISAGSGRTDDHLLLLVLDGSREASALDEECDLVADFAAQITLALARRSALELRQELAVVAERDRIARDLHDVIIQRLFAIGLQLSPISSRLGPPYQARLDWIIDDLDLTIDEIRSTIGDLLPSIRKDSLRTTTRALMAEYALVLPHPPVLRITGPLDTAVPATLHHEVVAVLREGLSNVAKHSDAQHVHVRLRADAQQLTCTVLDDGTGIVEGPETIRSGLRNLDERAAALGGSFDIRPGDGCGTVLVWQIPLGPRVSL